MSMSYSDCFPDLLCSEDSEDVISAGDSSDLEYPVNVIDDDDEISIAGFIEDERSSGSSVSLSSVVNMDSSSRSQCVTWILKVKAFYGFQAVTAYLAVNYLDRYLSSHHPPQTRGWPLQLLSVACLSLAAKMEEPLVPSLLDLQVEGAKFIFEPKTIQRMELLVLGVLDWRLRSVTPFTFISFFAYKLDASGIYGGLLIARSTDIILSNVKETSFQEYWPSSIAAAAILCAASEMPNLSFVTPDHAESWCHGLCKDKVKNCYKLMKQYMVDHSRKKSKVIPQFRITAQITRVRSYNDLPSPSPSTSPSSSSSTSSPSPYKRRRLNNHSWVEDNNYESSG